MGFPSLSVFFFAFHLLLFKFCDAKCPKSFSCKDFGTLEYPFTDKGSPECGLMTVDCEARRFILGDEEYQVLEQISVDKFKVQDLSFGFHLKNRSCFSFRSILPIYPNISFIISPNLTIFRCDKFSSESEGGRGYFENYKNYSGCDPFTIYYRSPEDGKKHSRETDRPLPLGCSPIQVPAWDHTVNSSDDVFKLIAYEFNIEWHVQSTKGGQKKVILVAGASVAALTAVASFILLVFFRKKLLKSLEVRKVYAKNQADIELFLKNHGTLAPKMYKYKHLKKITNSFSESLGKGGYGVVYKGKLPDGRLVAVKILSESQGNGEEFMNEVSSISRTSHVNVVALLGFCFDRSKRALVYEFMPNGSLEKFIPNHAAASSSSPNSSLQVDKLFEIVVGIARGLEYLHQGCSTRILHFDIKPHNILLDKDFEPKISDFGLSKLCPNRSSVVSMQVARGTVGYIAPEVFCRNFGEVSHKSDVYSYGMMVLEMVVGRQHGFDPQGERSSEIQFSDWIYKHFEKTTSEKLGLVDNIDTSQEDTDISQEDEENFVRRKLMIVGLWCIQTDPKNRPPISSVIEMLEAKLESLQIPPRPYFYSPMLRSIFSGSEPQSLL